MCICVFSLFSGTCSLPPHPPYQRKITLLTGPIMAYIVKSLISSHILPNLAFCFSPVDDMRQDPRWVFWAEEDFPLTLDTSVPLRNQKYENIRNWEIFQGFPFIFWTLSRTCSRKLLPMWVQNSEFAQNLLYHCSMCLTWVKHPKIYLGYSPDY